MSYVTVFDILQEIRRPLYFSELSRLYIPDIYISLGGGRRYPQNPPGQHLYEKLVFFSKFAQNLEFHQKLEVRSAQKFNVCETWVVLFSTFYVEFY